MKSGNFDTTFPMKLYRTDSAPVFTPDKVGKLVTNAIKIVAFEVDFFCRHSCMLVRLLRYGIAYRLASCDAFVAIDVAHRPRNPETTALYQVVAEQLETFLARQEERERPVPPFVEREFRDYLTCGVLAARGFIRVHCDSCGHDRLVPFSCRRRGWCPSCGGRRMAETAAHLVDYVFPIVPVRQWVLSSSSL